MAKKNISPVSKTTTKPVSTPVRNSAIPKAAALAAKKPVAVEITQDQIATRAYEIWLSGTGGSESDNWFRAERELRGL
jgi:hypothetical protein